MSTLHRIAGAAVFTAVFASIVPAATALPPVGTEPPPPVCPRGYVLMSAGTQAVRYSVRRYLHAISDRGQP